MTKFTLAGLLVIVLLASSCDHASPPTSVETLQPAVVVMPTVPPVPGKSADCALPAYDLKSLAEKVTASARLPLSVVRKLVQGNPQLPRYFQESPDLTPLDTVRCAGYTLVSLLWEHDTCCEDVYYLTFAPNSQRLLDWKQVASQGADGFWQAKSTMRVGTEGRLTVTTLAENQEDEGAAYYRDSLTRRYSVTPEGHFVTLLKDSVRTHHLRSDR